MSESKCSRAGCVAPAANLIDWRNPTVHKGDRVKTWAACADHLSYLVDYLSTRGFFLESRKI